MKMSIEVSQMYNTKSIVCMQDVKPNDALLELKDGLYGACIIIEGAAH